MPDTFLEHLCLLIFAQDQWKEKDYSRIFNSSVSTRREHSDCDTCCSCPVCRSYWAFYDPKIDDDYFIPCGLCEELVKRFDNKKGQNHGFLLFSHSLLQKNELLELTELLLEEDKVKKIFLFQIDYYKGQKKASEVLQQVGKIKLKRNEFNDLLNVDNLQLEKIYEVSKDSYY